MYYKSKTLTYDSNILGESAKEQNELVTFIKANNEILNQTSEIKISELDMNKINVKNVAAYFGLANVFYLQKLAEIIMQYIERCFQMIAETNGFLRVYVKIARADKIARRDKIARGDKITRRNFCTETNLHERTKLREDIFARLSNLHGGSNLHEDTFARADNFARRHICTEGHFCTSDNFARKIFF